MNVANRPINKHMYDSELCVSLAKKNELLSLYKSSCISIEFHPYYEALSTGKKVNGTMDDNSDAETIID